MACLCLPSSLFLIASDKSGAEFADVCTSESILSDIVFSELFSQLEKRNTKEMQRIMFLKMLIVAMFNFSFIGLC